MNVGLYPEHDGPVPGPWVKRDRAKAWKDSIPFPTLPRSGRKDKSVVHLTRIRVYPYFTTACQLRDPWPFIHSALCPVVADMCPHIGASNALWMKNTKTTQHGGNDPLYLTSKYRDVVELECKVCKVTVGVSVTEAFLRDGYVVVEVRREVRDKGDEAWLGRMIVPWQSRW